MERTQSRKALLRPSHLSRLLFLKDQVFQKVYAMAAAFVLLALSNNVSILLNDGTWAP
ncbi:MAG TPA: hypothetical protein VKU02_17510 [Gemmataceae bacterium]|nr:hypothetical protein [Gemmataceae bacterium]